MKSIATALLAIMVLGAPSVAQDIQPGTNLVIEGIPAIPSSLAEAAGRYTEFRSASLLSWHPVKREILIGTRFADTSQVHSVRFPGGARTQLTFFSDRVDWASYSPVRSDYFVLGKDIGGNEFYQAYRFDLSTGGITLLTDGRSKNDAGVWSRQGDRYAYGSTRRNGADVDIYVVSPADPKSDHLLVELQGGGWAPLDWSPDGRTLLVSEFVSINESYLWLVDTGTGAKSLITPKGGDQKISYAFGQFSAGGKSLYVLTDKDSEYHRLASFDIATGKHRFLTDQISWDVEQFDLSPDGSVIAFTTNEDGLSVLRRMETVSLKQRILPGISKGILSNLQWHENGRDLGFNMSSAHSPSDVYSVDVTTNQLERWTYSEAGGLNTESFREPELIHWSSFDGRSIPGFLYTPGGAPAGSRGRKWPVIVNIHGGPEGQSRPGFLARNNYYLNEMGVAIIYPNIRGSTGYGKTYLKLDNGLKREDSYKDIAALFDWIRTRPDLDADRILVIGGSYGGHMTLAVATYYPDRICAAIDIVGISNLATFLEKTESYRRDLRRVEYGDERDPEMRAFFERTAPVNNAAKITKPLFVVQGKNDPRVPLYEAEQIVATVKKIGTPIWYLMATDEGHGFVKKKNADFQFYATIMFVKRFLLG